MKEENPTIGTVEWVKSLSDDALEAIKAVTADFEGLNHGMWSDEDFDLENRIEDLANTLQREKLYRVGIALGIRPEKVNKTVGYLMEDGFDESGEQAAIDAMERRISIAETDFEEDSQFKTGDGPL